MTYRYITVIYSAYRRVLMSMEPQYGDQGAWPWEKAANPKFRFCIDLGAMHSYAIKTGKTWKNTKKTSLAVPTVTYVHSELDPVKSDPWSTWSDFVYGRSRRELRSVSYIDAWQQLKRKEKQSLEQCVSHFSQFLQERKLEAEAVLNRSLNAFRHVPCAGRTRKQGQFE